MNGKVLIFRLQILGCDRDGKISTVVRMVNYLWEWDGDRENLMEMGRDGDNLIYRVPLYRRQN